MQTKNIESLTSQDKQAIFWIVTVILMIVEVTGFLITGSWWWWMATVLPMIPWGVNFSEK